jgi:hypothetical protein
MSNGEPGVEFGPGGGAGSTWQEVSLEDVKEAVLLANEYKASGPEYLSGDVMDRVLKATNRAEIYEILIDAGCHRSEVMHLTFFSKPSTRTDQILDRVIEGWAEAERPIIDHLIGEMPDSTQAERDAVLRGRTESPRDWLNRLWGEMDSEVLLDTLQQIDLLELVGPVLTEEERVRRNVVLHEEAEVPLHGRMAKNVMIVDMATGDQLGLGWVWGPDNQVGGDLVVYIPGTAPDEYAAAAFGGAAPYEQGQEIEIVFGSTDDVGNTAYDTIFGDPGEVPEKGVTARVFFKGATEEDVQEEIDNQGLGFSAGLGEIEVPEGEDIAGFGGFEINIDEINAAVAALTGQETFLGGTTPAKVLVDGQTGERLRLARLFGEDESLVGERDPMTGKIIGEIREVQPFFEIEHVYRFFDGMPDEVKADWQRVLADAGLLQPHLVGQPINQFDPSDPTVMAVEIAMTYSNHQGILDGQLISNPLAAVHQAILALGARPQPIPEWQSATVRVMPDDDELWNVVQNYALQRTGHRLGDEQVAQFVTYLEDQYELSFNQADLIAEREYLAEQAALGGDPDEQQQEALAGPDTVDQINPLASFQRHFEQAYSGSLAIRDRKDERQRMQDSILGTVLTLKRRQ